MYKMYKITKKGAKLTVVCENCHERGFVSKKCHMCGGHGFRKRTVDYWYVSKHLENIEKIDRAKFQSEYCGQILCEQGELRYWSSANEFFAESSKLLHFSYDDAESECFRRNVKNLPYGAITEIERQMRCK